MNLTQSRKAVKSMAISGLFLLCDCSAAPNQAPEFIPLPGLGNFTMIIPDGSSPDRWKGLAKDQCGPIENCSVFGWTRKEDGARALPMTDAEEASQAFMYTLNRSTGHEQVMWDCQRFKRSNPDECFAVPDQLSTE